MEHTAASQRLGEAQRLARRLHELDQVLGPARPPAQRSPAHAAAGQYGHAAAGQHHPAGQHYASQGQGLYSQGQQQGSQGPAGAAQSSVRRMHRASSEAKGPNVLVATGDEP